MPDRIEYRRLGDAQVSALGLGCMGMSDIYATHDEDAGLRTIHAALEAGVTFLNTGDFYGQGRNEMLIGRALKGKRDRAFLSVKAGALKGPDGQYFGFDMRPAAMRNFIGYSLARLGTDYIDLYQPSRVDPAVPIEETVGAVARLVEEGYVRHIGLSEAGPDSLRRAHATHPIAALEVEYSLMARDIEADLLPLCRELGVGVVAYSVLAGGLLGGRIDPATLEHDSMRAHGPRYQPGAIEQNLALVRRVSAIAEAKGVTVAQLAVAWVLAQGRDIVPLIGARTPERLHEAIGALAVELSAEDLEALEAAVPPSQVAGRQYEGFVQAMIDRERAQGARTA